MHPNVRIKVTTRPTSALQYSVGRDAQHITDASGKGSQQEVQDVEAGGKLASILTPRDSVQASSSAPQRASLQTIASFPTSPLQSVLSSASAAALYPAECVLMKRTALSSKLNSCCNKLDLLSCLFSWSASSKHGYSSACDRVGCPDATSSCQTRHPVQHHCMWGDFDGRLRKTRIQSSFWAGQLASVDRITLPGIVQEQGSERSGNSLP